jgi:hypothetical protein
MDMVRIKNLPTGRSVGVTADVDVTAGVGVTIGEGTGSTTSDTALCFLLKRVQMAVFCYNKFITWDICPIHKQNTL